MASSGPNYTGGRPCAEDGKTGGLEDSRRETKHDKFFQKLNQQISFKYGNIMRVLDEIDERIHSANQQHDSLTQGSISRDLKKIRKQQESLETVVKHVTAAQKRDH